MSLTTVTLALDDKLRSLRNSSFESDQKTDSDSKSQVVKENRTTTTTTQSTSSTAAAVAAAGTTATTITMKNPTVDRLQPLILGGENIPYADESPERPLIQSRSKPIRVQTYNLPSSARYTTTTRLYSQSSTSPNTSPTDILSSSQSHSSQENVVKVVSLPVVKAPSSVSSDTDTSTTSNPMDSKCSSTIRIDREMIREMNRILTTLERKATKLNRSLSLNYKNHKGECCCNGNGGAINNNNNYRASISNNRFSLTKDEKTDKNINKKRQIQDGKSRRYTNRSIKRRHTVGGTHDYGGLKATNGEMRCQQDGHDDNEGDVVSTRTSSPDLTKDNHVLNDNKIISNE